MKQKNEISGAEPSAPYFYLKGKKKIRLWADCRFCDLSEAEQCACLSEGAVFIIPGGAEGPIGKTQRMSTPTKESLRQYDEASICKANGGSVFFTANMTERSSVFWGKWGKHSFCSAI